MNLHNVSLFAASMLLLATLALAQPPADSEIRKILADRIGAENLGIGMVVGVIDAKGRRVVSYGSLAKNDTRPLNGDTIFEIGSMTKVFTSLVLMDMVQKGEVALSDPVAKYLPVSVKVPERNGRKITLADLSTQSSGLPRLPSNLDSKDPANPYAGYSAEHLYRFLSGYRLTRDIGSQYEYSNLGVGLLGHVLTLRAGMDYEAVVRSRILDPLSMNSTRVSLSPDMKARLAVGHAGLNEVPNWDMAVLAGAGALRSDANDILTFLAANLGYLKTPLAAAMAAEVSVRRPAGSPSTQIAYAWQVQTKNGNTIIWHSGATGGYRTYMGYDAKSRVGVVLLSNIASEPGTDDIGRHLLDASYPIKKAEPLGEHKEITVDTKILDKYVGTYQRAPAPIITVTREGDQLMTQIRGQGKVPVYPEGVGKFFLKVVDAQITFDTDAQGSTTQLVLHQSGRDMVAMRIDAAEAALADALAKRVKEQTPAPGSQAALQRIINGMRIGKPKYELMTPACADATRRHLPEMKAFIVQLGALGAVQSLTFKEVGRDGGDVYKVKFDYGSSEWRIAMQPDGKVAWFTRANPAAH